MIAKTVLAVPLMVQAITFGGAKVLRIEPMRQRAAHVGMSVDEYSRIGILEILAAVGLAIGAVVPAIGVLAACGLLVLLGGALVTHLRAGDRLADLAPAMTVAALATAYIVVSVITS
jgi:DoxX-like protein